MEAGGTPPPGSFLSRFHQDLDDPAGLGSFRVTHEDERSSRAHERPREELWTRFLRDVNAYVFTIISEELLFTHFSEKNCHVMHNCRSFNLTSSASSAILRTDLRISTSLEPLVSWGHRHQPRMILPTLPTCRLSPGNSSLDRMPQLSKSGYHSKNMCCQVHSRLYSLPLILFT